MIRINLLPHREQKRRARALRFAALAALSASVGAFVIAVSYAWLAHQISMQDERNQFLTDVNNQLDKQIAEIDTLKKERQQLLDRKKVVERLQANRAESVKIFDQLTRQTPEGIELKTVSQTDDVVSIDGLAQSNARVSTFMRALADSTVFEHASPNLIEIRAAGGAQALSAFTLTVKVMREQVDDDKSKHHGPGAKK